MDIGWQNWPFTVQLAYRDATGVNPQYALMQIAKAFEQAAAEEADEQTVPAQLLNFDPRWLLGFVWIAERRERHGLRFADLMEEVNYPDLLMGVMEAFEELFKDEEEPEAEQAPLAADDSSASQSPTTPSFPRSKTASRSAKSSAGGSPTSSS